MNGVAQGSSSFGDVNNDGHLDLLVTGVDADGDPSATLYRGNGDGDLTMIDAELTGVAQSSSSLGDVDENGNLDLVITGADASGTATATLYLGNGKGAFEKAHAGLSGVQGGSSSIGDVDGDGHLDLLLTGAGPDGRPTATLYWGNGTGSFTEATLGLAGVTQSSSAVANVNGDGYLDFVVTGADAGGAPSATLYLSNGPREFTGVEDELNGIRGGASSFGDINNDGSTDLVLSGKEASGDPTTTLYLGDGTGAFAVSKTEVKGVEEDASLSLGDVDGDGNLDLVLTGRHRYFSATALQYLGDGEGGFTRSDAGIVSVGASSSAFGDVNEDGHLDLVVTGMNVSETRTARLYVGDGEGGYLGLTGVRKRPSSSFGDINGDGTPELVLTGRDVNSRSSTRVYRTDDPGSFRRLHSGLKGVSKGSSSFGDVNDDGHLDLVLTGSFGNGSASILYLGEGDGEFTKANASLPGINFSTSSLGDVNHDGHLDLVLAGNVAIAAPITRLYLGNGRGGFREAHASLVGVSYGDSALGDVNNDGHLDLVVTGSHGGVHFTPLTTLYLGNGQGEFTATNAGLVDVADGSVSLGDLNGDGNLDLVLTGAGMEDNKFVTSKVYLGGGDATFTPVKANLTDVHHSSSTLGDVNNDGALDLLITGDAAVSDREADKRATLYFGNGEGGFERAEAGLMAVYLGSASFADVNGDGNLDLVIVGARKQLPTATLYLGDGQGGFAPVPP